MVNDEIFQLGSQVGELLVSAWARGRRGIRILLIVALVGTVAGISFAAAGVRDPSRQPLWNTLCGASLGLAVVVGAGVSGYERFLRRAEKQAKIQLVEQRAQDNPDQPQLAWDLARLRLESYLDRNLSQARWIFFLTVGVSLAGFALIGVGTYFVYKSPEQFKPSIVVAVTGLLVQFLSATFLLVYRSTVEQSQNYVAVLERINAVGMSVQILAQISDDGKEPKDQLRDKTRAEVAKSLLSLYGSVKAAAPGAAKAGSRKAKPKDDSE